MTDTSTAQGREPTEPRNPEPFFPSEGPFNTVVPLSQVAHAPFNADATPDAGRPAEADWAREDRRASEMSAGDEEETLIPGRAAKARVRARAPRSGGVRHSWSAIAIAVALSVSAGLGAGAYLVWSQQTREAQTSPTRAADALTSNEVAAEITEPEPITPGVVEPATSATTDAPEVAAAASDEDVPLGREEVSASAPKPAATEAAPRASTAEPPAARRALETEPRAERRARVNAEAPAAPPAPKPAPRETAPRRAAARTQTRPPVTAPAVRNLPVSSPPSSARPRTVIQWP